jgi:hypothetical protein
MDEREYPKYYKISPTMRAIVPGASGQVLVWADVENPFSDKNSGAYTGKYFKRNRRNILGFKSGSWSRLFETKESLLDDDEGIYAVGEVPYGNVYGVWELVKQTGTYADGPGYYYVWLGDDAPRDRAVGYLMSLLDESQHKSDQLSDQLYGTNLVAEKQAAARDEAERSAKTKQNEDNLRRSKCDEGQMLVRLNCPRNTQSTSYPSPYYDSYSGDSLSNMSALNTGVGAVSDALSNYAHHHHGSKRKTKKRKTLKKSRKVKRRKTLKTIT